MAMHAFLLVGDNIEPILKKINAKPVEFPILKIDEVRALNKELSLYYNEPTAIICRNIDIAQEEAVNAFLKNLEEPQKNIYFILTTSGIRKVLPTIVSRCQIVWDKIQKLDEKLLKTGQKFLDKSPGDKFNYIDKIKERQDGLDLAESLIHILHSQTQESGISYKNAAICMKAALDAFVNIKANGNTNLQLSNLSIILNSNPLKSSKN